MSYTNFNLLHLCRGMDVIPSDHGRLVSTKTPDFLQSIEPVSNLVWGVLQISGLFEMPGNNML